MKQELNETAGGEEDVLKANEMSNNANQNTNDYSLPPPPSQDQILGNNCLKNISRNLQNIRAHPLLKCIFTFK